MPWQKGQSGNPHGANSKKMMRDALNLALSEKVKGVKKLRLVAEKLVQKALEGDTVAIKEVMDRMDGKAVQQVDMNIRDQIAEEATDDALNAIIQHHTRRGRNGTAQKANGKEKPDSIH